MSATRDLIAAALAAADQLDMRHFGWVRAEELREACARAMVQPAAPDMGEVERLINEFGVSCNSVAKRGHITSLKPLGQQITEHRASRTALLDYVRNIIAECDGLIADNERLMQISAQEVSKRVPVGWTLVPIEPTRGMLDAYAKNGARFNSARSDWAAMLAAAPQPVSAAEVPMPDVHDYGYLDSDIGWVETLACDEADVRTYGDAREAAGYARGIADRFDLAHELEGVQADVDQRHNFDATCRNTLARVIAALRGEVKP